MNLPERNVLPRGSSNFYNAPFQSARDLVRFNDRRTKEARGSRRRDIENNEAVEMTHGILCPTRNGTQFAKFA